MSILAAFPGSYNPPTVAHLAMAEATVRQCSVERVDLVLSRSTIGKEHVVHPTIDERADVLRSIASTRPWLGVVVTDARLLVDIGAGYDVLVLGADKWEQVLDVVHYGGSIAARDDAVARLPRLAVARRREHALPDDGRAVVLEIDVGHISSTAARAGARDLMLPEAIASGLWD
ncbi:MAG: nicotinate-nucleotide adenylyltransferase [Actinomycetota bacterium]|nr:nicotinate-nucleotide adenylyltransferase [Actinomycetota bacterium]